MIKKSGKDVVVDRDELLRVIRQLVEPIIDDVDPGGYHRSFLLGGVSVELSLGDLSDTSEDKLNKQITDCVAELISSGELVEVREVIYNAAAHQKHTSGRVPITAYLIDPTTQTIEPVQLTRQPDELREIYQIL